MAKKSERQSAASKPQEPPFESGSVSGSDTDGSNPQVGSTPTQKSTNGERKPRSKSSAPDPVSPTVSVAGKRHADDKESEAKKSKKKAEPEKSEEKPTDDPKKTQNQRVWCDEDEIVILKGLVDYPAEKKSDPFADLKDFHEFIKKDLQRKDSIKTQLYEKIRRLKTKFENNRTRETNCKELTFQKPHEQEVYELSKIVWGNKIVKENGVDKAKTVAAAVDSESENVKSIESETEKHEDPREKEWTELRMEEMKVYLRLLEVKSAQARFVIERL